jgi:hypothetical protein
MAKKKAAKKKAPAKGAKKKAPAKRKEEQIEIHLDAVEQKALDLVQASDQVCNEIERDVTAAVAKAVGAVFKKHKINLTPAQAENVALILFGN